MTIVNFYGSVSSPNWPCSFKDFFFLIHYCSNTKIMSCLGCLLNIHRWCVRTLEESCAGPLVKKDKGNDRISKLMDRIRPEQTRRKPSHLNATHSKCRKVDSHTPHVSLHTQTRNLYICILNLFTNSQDIFYYYFDYSICWLPSSWFCS